MVFRDQCWRLKHLLGWWRMGVVQNLNWFWLWAAVGDTTEAVVNARWMCRILQSWASNEVAEDVNDAKIKYENGWKGGAAVALVVVGWMFESAWRIVNWRWWSYCSQETRNWWWYIAVLQCLNFGVLNCREMAWADTDGGTELVIGIGGKVYRELQLIMNTLQEDGLQLVKFRLGLISSSW